MRLNIRLIKIGKKGKESFFLCFFEKEMKKKKNFVEIIVL